MIIAYVKYKNVKVLAIDKITAGSVWLYYTNSDWLSSRSSLKFFDPNVCKMSPEIGDRGQRFAK